jgi:hypothetical protein
MHCPCVFEIALEKARKNPVGFLLCFYPQVMISVHVISYCLWTNMIMSLSSGGKPSTWWCLGWCGYKTWYWFIKFCNGQQGTSFLLSWSIFPLNFCDHKFVYRISAFLYYKVWKCCFLVLERVMCCIEGFPPIKDIKSV